MQTAYVTVSQAGRTLTCLLSHTPPGFQPVACLKLVVATCTILNLQSCYDIRAGCEFERTNGADSSFVLPSLTLRCPRSHGHVRVRTGYKLRGQKEEAA